MIVYKYDTETKEFIQELEINEAYGTNLPFTTTTKPLAKKDGFAVCFNNTKWEYVEDNRNTVVYNKETKQESKIDYLGKIKEDVTTLKPKQFDKWDYETNSWVCDKVKKETQRIQDIKAKASELIISKYSIVWQLNHPRTDVTYASDYAYIDNIRDISNKAEVKGTALEDIDWNI